MRSRAAAKISRVTEAIAALDERPEGIEAKEVILKRMKLNERTFRQTRDYLVMKILENHGKI